MAAYYGIRFSRWVPSPGRRAAMRKRLEGTLEDIAQRAADTRVFGPEYGTVSGRASRRRKPEPAWMTDEAIVHEFTTLLEERKASDVPPAAKAAMTRRLNELLAEARKRLESRQEPDADVA
jgi:hypothetical protein